jgi:hypothetical protein
MRKTRFVVCVAVLVLLFQSIAFGANLENISKPNFDVKINNNKIYDKEGMFTYKDVLYVPIDHGKLDINGVKRYEKYDNGYVLLSNIQYDGKEVYTWDFPIISYEGQYYLPACKKISDLLDWEITWDNDEGLLVNTNSDEGILIKEDVKYRAILSDYIRKINRKLTKDEADYIIELTLNASEKYEIDEKLILAMMWLESNYDANCRTGQAVGLMQMLVSTAKHFDLTAEDLYDPATNIDVCVRYLRGDLDYFKDINKAVTAYNWGPINVIKGRAKPIYLNNVMGKKAKIEAYVEKRLSEQ